MKLTSANVAVAFLDCLFNKSEKIGDANIIQVDGAMQSFGFNISRVDSHRDVICSMLSQLPGPFHKDSGGGWSFLQGVCDKQDNQWGEHQNVDQLMTLGIALGVVTYITPREMWVTLPGDMPFFQVDVKDMQ